MPPIATVGCLLSGLVVMLGCCLLAGPVGLAITAVVVIHVSRDIRRCDCGRRHREIALSSCMPEASPQRKEDPMPSPGEPPNTRSFWDSLSPDERHAFVSTAEERTFAAGARLVIEGERADRVMLIRDGWTKICVSDQGREHVIAERGPGQLIGERAALQVNVRSASVIALETVHALVMPTEDFAGFVGAHPRVLDIVEGSVYERLTTPRDFRDARPHGRDLTTVSRPRQAPAKRGGSFNGENCTIVFTDVAGFGSHTRNDEDRRQIRESSFAMIREAFDAAGIAWESCHWEDRGDGLLIVIPSDIPTKKVLAELPDRLSAALKQHNRRYSAAVRIQLRLAVHVGPVTTDPVGQSGESIICAARLLDAPALKRGLTAQAANLGIIVSGFVYDTVVKHLDPDGYRLVKVKVKESRLDAWMRLTGTAPPS